MAEERKMQRLSEARKRTFLQVLRATGSPRRAAAAASPHAKGSCIQSFGDLARRDIEFAQAWQDAMQGFIGDLEQELVLRAKDRTIEVRASSDRLLLRLLEKHDKSYRPGHQIDQNIDINVQANILALNASDVLLLSPAKRAAFVELLEEIADLRGEDDTDGQGPKLLE